MPSQLEHQPLEGRGFTCLAPTVSFYLEQGWASSQASTDIPQINEHMVEPTTTRLRGPVGTVSTEEERILVAHHPGARFEWNSGQNR